MTQTGVFAVGLLGALLLGLGVIAYLRRPLEKILLELCGNQERAGFWTAFSAVSLGLMPVIFAIGCHPAPGPRSPAVFELAEQLKWGLIGLMSTVLVLGWMIARTIVRWEKQARAKA